MKRFVITFSAVAVLAAGCAKEISAPEIARTVLSLSINDTKTTFGDLSEGYRPMYWADGDVIAVNGVSSNPLAGVPAESATAEFEFSAILEKPYSIVYPASIWSDASHVSLPSVAGNVPLVGYAAADGSASVSYATSVLKFSVTDGTGESPRIEYLEVKSAGTQLSGLFSASFADGTISSAETASASNCFVRKSVGTISNSATEVYVPVPAGTYGFTVRLIDSKGHYMEKTASSRELVAGKIHSFPVISFVPTGTQFDVTIGNADEWNEFAQSFNEGDFDDVRPLAVSIDADLDFTSLTNTPVGDYPSTKYCHAAIYGNGHKIVNLHSGTPLVAAVDANGCIEDLEIDSSCSFDFVLGVDRQTHLAPFAEYLKGTIRNCVNNADITVGAPAVAIGSNVSYFGGLVGRVREGLVDGCTNNGNITVSTAFSSSSNTFIGGIVGYMSNADGEVLDCVNTGTLKSSAMTTWNVVGGIVGNNAGKITSCTNQGTVTADMARPSGDACKHVFLGGIAGVIKGGEVVDCVNSTDLATSSAVKLQYIGGIAGDVAGTASLSRNTSSGSIISTGGVRCVFYGGLYGRVSSENTIELEDTPFSGAITVSGHENSSSNAYLNIGGIVGLATKNLIVKAAEGKTCTINNDIAINVTAAIGAARVNMGGVVGAAGEVGSNSEAYVPNLSNSTVTIQGITTSGNIKVNASGIAVTYKMLDMGGILGAAFGGATIQDCSSSAAVYCGSASLSQNNGAVTHMGGIAGRIDGGNSVISGCSSSYRVYCYQYNNNAWNIASHNGGSCLGGIVGSFGYKVDNRSNGYTCQISDCSSTATVYGYRGVGGGIAGYLNSATVSDCTFTGKISRGAAAAGIVAATEYCAVSNCIAKSTSIAGNGAGSCVGNGGGIVGDSVSTSIDGCKSFSTITCAGTGAIAGGIIAKPDAASTIGATSSCYLGGTVAGTAVSDANLEALAIGNTAMTPASVILWDGK